MLRKCTKVFVCLILAVALLSPSATVVFGNFILTNRDTHLPPGRVVFEDIPMYEYVFLGQFGNLRYYFREDRDIILVEDVRGYFTWRTGLDAPFGIDVPDLIDAAETDEELRRVAEPIEERLNATWTAKANSILTVEFFDSAYNILRVSSSARGVPVEVASSTLVELAHGHFRLDAMFYNIDLFVPVHIFLSDVGITYHIAYNEMSGEGLSVLSALVLTPFMGAAGGSRSHFCFETRQQLPSEPVPMIPGYIFVPDGSGALIRFRENSVNFSSYVGSVFGNNPAEAQFFFNDDDVSGIGQLHPIMPVFGVTQGYNQQAFVAWADEGAEFMEIHMNPHNAITLYNFVYPRFVINQVMHQVYNRRGDGFFRLFPNRRQFNITMQYRFLYGEDANYVGMARTYRQHLIEQGILTPNSVPNDGVMPLRLDFIMSDVRRSVIGRTNVVTTTADQVGEIVTDLMNAGVASVNGGLMGFQRGGVTTGRPWTISFSRAIGTRRDFTNLFNDMAAIGADISFAQDYYRINSHQMNLSRNQAFHINRWGIRAFTSFEPFLPVNEISFARPARSADWFQRQTARAAEVGAPSATVSGITDNLTSHWGRNDGTCTLTSIQIIQDALADSPLPVNAHAPNKFLWAYTHRFLQSPVFNSQHMITTDTVPFLQLVLHNTMEVYAPYSNFSFYTQRDILRMIDYNVFPSFVVTYRPAHYLSSTNSLNFYSTEYSIYRDIILNVYHQVSPILSQVKGLEWTNRQVLAEGVILNTYEGGVEVIINYSYDTFTHNGIGVAPLTARLFR